MGKRSDYNTRYRAVPAILGLAICFVAPGCGILKSDTDEIGDGYLSEDGWDPFSDSPRTDRSRKRDRKEDDSIADADDELAPDVPVGNVSASKKPSTGAGKRVEDLFKNGDYRKALSEARNLRSKSAPGSESRDIADFVAGASQYYLGEFRAAQPILDTHIKAFPDSRHRESALYYQASNHVRLRQWRVGASLLDNYIANYPESLLLEFALFDRATCHHGLGEIDSCLQATERLEREYIYSKIRDRSLALKGDALREKGDLAGSQAAYQKARAAAEELKHPELEARCLASLTSVAALRGDNSTSVKYYKAFFKQHKNSQYASEAALGGLPALKATGELASGLKNLESVLQNMPQKTDASVFNESLVAYAKFYREAHGPDRLLQQLGDLSSSPDGSARLKEQLIVARLEALEAYFPDNDAEIRVFYKEMRSRFKPSELSATNVLKMADYIAETNPDEALPWYENAVSRGSSLHQARATLGLAKAQAKLGKAREAETGYRKVLETFGSPELAEEATLGIARIARQKKDWSASAYYWGNYLDHKDWTLARDEARGGLDESKSKGGVAKAPKSSHTIPVKALPSDPVSRELAIVESLANSGKKEAAYTALEKMLKRFQSTEGLPESAATALSKAEVMHEDLGIELGK